MTKSLEVISEAIRNPKHPFRKVDNQPKKPLKHRYERRKIKGYLHLEDWMALTFQPTLIPSRGFLLGLSLAKTDFATAIPRCIINCLHR